MQGWKRCKDAGRLSVRSDGLASPPSVPQILESVAKLREQGWEYALEASFIEVSRRRGQQRREGGGGGLCHFAT